MAEITIRPLAATDREAWTPLWHGYLTFYKASLAPETSDTTFARLTGGAEPMGGFIAERDGRAVGIADGRWLQLSSDRGYAEDSTAIQSAGFQEVRRRVQQCIARGERDQTRCCSLGVAQRHSRGSAQAR